MRQFKLQHFLLFLALGLLTIFLDSQGVFAPVRPVFQFVLLPVSNATHSIKNGLADSFSFISFWRSGEARIKNLEQRNIELTIKSNNLEAIEKENEELKKQLGVAFLADFKRLPASVLGVGRYMTIDRGAKDGVKVGQTVVSADNLVGLVKRVDAHASFVQVPTDVDSKILVKIGAVGTVKGVTVGQFNSAISLDQVAQNEEVRVNDLVLSSGDEGRVVPDLIIGKVKKITSQPTDLFKKADVNPLVKYGQLTTVFVLLP